MPPVSFLSALHSAQLVFCNATLFVARDPLNCKITSPDALSCTDLLNEYLLKCTIIVCLFIRAGELSITEHPFNLIYRIHVFELRRFG